MSRPGSFVISREMQSTFPLSFLTIRRVRRSHRGSTAKNPSGRHRSQVELVTPSQPGVGEPFRFASRRGREMASAILPFPPADAHIRGCPAIAFLGKRAFSAMIDQSDVEWGRHPTRCAGTTAWLLADPSGLNKAFTLDALVTAYGDLRTALLAEPSPREC